MEAERLRAALTEHTGKAVGVHPAGAAQTHTYSRIQPFLLQIPGEAARRIIVKEPHGKKAADPELAFAALQTLDQHFRTLPDLHSPAPLLALPDSPALIMEAAAGQPLYKILQKCRRPCRAAALDKALGAAAGTGRWLAHLHRLPPPLWAQPLPPAPDRLLLVLERLHRLGVSDHWLAEIENGLSSRLTGRDNAPVVVLHGDLTLRNVLQAPDAITLLDTELAWHGPAAYDLAHFLAALSFIDRWHMLIGQWLYEIEVIGAVKQAFLAAYIAEHGPIDPEILAAHTIVRVLQRWAEYSEQARAQHPLIGPILAKIAKRHFRRVVEKMTVTSA